MGIGPNYIDTYVVNAGTKSEPDVHASGRVRCRFRLCQLTSRNWYRTLTLMAGFALLPKWANAQSEPKNPPIVQDASDKPLANAKGVAFTAGIGYDHKVPRRGIGCATSRSRC